MGVTAIIGKLFGGKVVDTVSELGKVADALSTSAEERLAVKAAVAKAVIQAQASIIMAENAAGGVSAKWRPYAALSFVAMIWWWALASPMGWQPPDLTGVPDNVWYFLFGYGTYREVGKTVAHFRGAKELKALAKLAAQVKT